MAEAAGALAPESYFTIKDAAGYLRISEQTIFRWMRSGRLAFYRFGGSTRFRRPDLDAAAERVGPRLPGESIRRCPVCGCTGFAEGELRSTGKIYFVPRRTRFLTLRTSNVAIEARTCTVCGHVELFAETAKLKKLLTEGDLAALDEKERGEEEAAEKQPERAALGRSAGATPSGADRR